MMDEIRCLLEEMADAGIRLWVEDGKLKFRAPSGAMTVERANLIKKNRDAVIAALNEPRPIKREPEKRYDPYPLTDIQQAYQLGKSEAYPYGGVGCQGYMEISLGGVEFERLNNAWRKVVARHDVLHSVISEDGYQQVLEEYDVGLIEFVEAESRSLEEVASECRRTMDHKDYATSVHPYELKVSTDGIKSILHISVNLALCDFLSITIILNDLARAYDGEQLDSSDEISFRDFVMDAKTRGVSSPSLKADEEYWSARIDELPPAPMLPMGPNPDVRTGVRFIRHQMSLTDNEWAEFRRTSAEKGVTPTAALVAAFSDTLALWAESSDFTINMTMLNRGDDIPGIMRTVGDFTMSSLLGLIRDERAPFFSRARAAQSQLWSDLEHRSFSGVSVLREIARRRGRAGGGALMPFVFTSSIGLRGGSSLSETSLFRGSRVIGGLSQTPQVWLDCQAMEWNGSLVINWDERAGVFPDGLVSDAFSSFEQTLRSLASSKATWEETRIVHLPQKQKLVRIAANDTGKEIVSSTLHSDFMKTALSHPELPAVRLGDEFVTYAELRALSLKVAHKLKRGVRTAIILEKSIAQVVAVIGCSLAGAPFIPLSPDHPRSRVDTVMGNAEVGAVLAKAETLERLDLAGKEEAMDIDLILSDDISANFEDRTLPSDEAYVIYTSGSTGVPKGVAVSHAAAWNTIADVVRRWGMGPGDAVLGVSALDFDLSVFDIFGALSFGAAVVLPDEEERRDASAWRELVSSRGVTVWNSAPALLDVMLDDGPGAAAGLRLALVSGDWVPLGLRSKLPEGVLLVAMGGATEAGIWSNYFEVGEVDPSWSSIPYGRPLSNQSFRVVGEDGLDCPDWVPGELWIGGGSLADGYLGDPGKTAASFVEDGGRWYRTGDMGRYWPGAVLEFLGRKDSQQQVKIRGHRVELGEVEAAVAGCPGVKGAVAVVAGERERSVVHAFVVADEGADVDPAGVLSRVAGLLPSYFVPHDVTVLDEWPLSANGKVDRKALAGMAPEAAPSASSLSEPATEAERAVASVWEELLDAGPVGRESNFFELGGDSLMASRVIGRVRALGYEDARLQLLFDTENLSEFCKTLRKREAPPKQEALIEVDPSKEYESFPLTEIQHAYLVSRGDSSSQATVGTTYCQIFAVDEIDLDRLDAAWGKVQKRHGMMRASVEEDGTQSIAPSSKIGHIERAECANSSEAKQQLEEIKRTVFALAKPPLHRVVSISWHEESGKQTRLVFCFDYTVLDALSVMTVLAELAELYENPGADLPGIGLTFRDFVVGHRRDGREVEEAEGYWRSRLPELPPAPQLPLAADPSTVGEGRFERLWRTVAEPEWSAVKEKARLHGITPSAVLLACYARVLSAWSGGGGVTLNLTIFDRPEVHPDIDKVVGDFTTLLPVACRPSADASVEAQMRGVQNELAGGLEHRAVSAVWVQRELARSAGTSGVVLPVVFTSALGLSRFDLDGGFMDYLGGLSQTPQVWLDHQAMERGGGVMLSWDYVSELFPDGMIADMFDAYCSAVSSLAASDWSEPFPDLLPPSQRAARAEANSEGADLGGGTLHGRFFARAQAEPDAPALRWGADGEATYGELAGRALRIAGGLAAAGVGEGDRVAVRLPKGPGQVAAVLGVLAAGAAYVPVGVSQPEARAALILEQAGASLCVDSTELARLEAADPLPAPAGPSERALAYVIYTSGSTGVPKGVAVSHAAAWNTIADVVRRWGMGPGDAVLGVSALDFDLSVFDIFGALSFGAAVVLPDEEERRDASAWRELVSSRGVTVWNSAPALLDVMLDDGPGAAAGLRLALVSGDWVPLGLRSKLPEGVLLVAMGGATEAGIWSNYFEVGEVDPSWSSIPYGRPLSNQSFRVVGEDGLDCPDWVPGELWIGGGSLADGYLGDPGKTAASFVEDGGRWYRTGDMGRYWPGAVLEFLGRKDSQQQVKIRGHRVELGEVEAAVAGCPGVKGAVAVVAGERERSVVHAFVVADEGADVDPAGVLSRVAGLLPSYFVPHDVTVLDEWPLSANGKVDRKALAGMAPEAAPSASSLSEPATEAERAVASVWEELLDAGPVGRESNFFELGGDSLMAMRMTSALEKRLGFKIGLQEFISDPTVAGICQKIDTTCGDTYEEGTL